MEEDHVQKSDQTGTAPGRATPALVSAYPGLVCDLDGVVYRGAQPVPHAVATLGEIRGGGGRIAFATNNASRPPGEVADVLRGHGLTVDDDEVLTSSIAGAHQLAAALSPGATVLAIGGPGVAAALESVGLRAVLAADAPNSEVAAVLQGYGTDVTASDLGEAAYAIQSGAHWVATNDDLTLPTDRGVAPGNGSLVAAVQVAVEVQPTVVGKPGPLLYQLAADLLGTASDRTLGIGDRLETDVAGAHAAGMDALHVLTGVHGPADLVRAPAGSRPRYVGHDLRTLLEHYAEPEPAEHGWRLNGWHACVADGSNGRIEWTPMAPHAEPLSWIERLRLALRVLWSALDEGTVSAGQAVAALPAQQ